MFQKRVWTSPFQKFSRIRVKLKMNSVFMKMLNIQHNIEPLFKNGYLWRLSRVIACFTDFLYLITKYMLSKMIFVVNFLFVSFSWQHCDKFVYVDWHHHCWKEISFTCIKFCIFSFSIIEKLHYVIVSPEKATYTDYFRRRWQRRRPDFLVQSITSSL